MPELKAAPPTIASVKYSPETGMTPATFDEAWRMAQLFAASELVPKDYKGRPENCLVAMQLGAEIGLKPIQSLQGIAVINGRPSIWGDALWALVLSSQLVEDAHETFDPVKQVATCTIKRRGRSEPIVQTFSQEDAKIAGLWGKDGPWTTNPRRMLQMRARGFAARDAVPDVLKGVSMIEESQDIWLEQEKPAVRPGTAALEAKAREAAAASIATEGELRDYISKLDEVTTREDLFAVQEQAPQNIRNSTAFNSAFEIKAEVLNRLTDSRVEQR